MFCVKCGTQLSDDAIFCTNCGERVSGIETPKQRPVRANTKKLALPLGISAGIIAIVVLIVSLTFGGGYKRTLKNYYKAYENNDAELMYNSVVAQYWIDYTEKSFGRSYAMESIKEDIEDKIDYWDCGEYIDISYEIKSEKRANKEELEDLEDNIYDWFAHNVYDKDEFSITDAYVLDIEFTVVGSEGTVTLHYPDGLLLIKENGKWRIPRGTISCSFYDNL